MQSRLACSCSAESPCEEADLEPRLGYARPPTAWLEAHVVLDGRSGYVMVLRQGAALRYVNPTGVGLAQASGPAQATAIRRLADEVDIFFLLQGPNAWP